MLSQLDRPEIADALNLGEPSGNLSMTHSNFAKKRISTNDSLRDQEKLASKFLFKDSSAKNFSNEKHSVYNTVNLNHADLHKKRLLKTSRAEDNKRISEVPSPFEDNVF